MQDLPLRNFRPRPSLRVAGHRVTSARHPAIDVHNHLGRWLSPRQEWSVVDVPALLATLDACNVAAIVNLDGRWGAELEANLERYDRAHPGRFASFCQLDWAEAASAGFGERLADSVRRSAAAGARGVKVWKDLGLRVRDPDGRLLLPDDPRLGPVWAAAGELGLPVLIHTADPVAFFRPVDERNERLEELLAHPDWSFHDARFPPLERLLEALESLVAAHPGTAFIAAHVGCAEDLGWVGRLMDAYPNFHVDIGARVAELGRQPRATRRLLLRHPDRVLFGTDRFPPDADSYATYFRFLETDDEHFPYSDADPPRQGRWAVSGLHLPDDVLALVYRDNALRLVPGLTAAPAGG